MYRGSGPRVLPIIIVIIVIALVIAALVTVGRMIFSGGGSSNTSDNATASLQDAVLDKSSDRAVRWTVRGPIVADEKFRSYQITITPTSRTFVTYSGYLDQVNDTKKYDNNARAYEEFIFALDKAGIGKTRKSSDEEFRGVCATNGIAYMFETVKHSDVDNSVWSSSCKDSAGTMGATPVKIQALFVNQIPDFAPLFDEIY